MKKAWDDAKKAHGGKHAKGVQSTHDALAAGKTPQDREAALKTTMISNLQGMVDSGASLNDLFDALQHVVDGKAVILDGVQNGV